METVNINTHKTEVSGSSPEWPTIFLSGFKSACLFLFLAPVLHHFLYALSKLGVSPQTVNEDWATFQ